MSDKREEGKNRREIFVATLLRAAHSLRSSLKIDDANYTSVVGYGQIDPKAYFIYACLNVVTKFSIACIRWNEFSWRLNSSPIDQMNSKCGLEN